MIYKPDHNPFEKRDIKLNKEIPSPDDKSRSISPIGEGNQRKFVSI